MIKAALADADTPLGGEILRLLIHHPDVDIAGLVTPLHKGEDVTSLHHGFIGETPLRFCSEMPKKANAIFYCGDTGPDEQMHARAAAGEVKIFDVSRNTYLNHNSTPAVPAISEIFRKPLVRGASECRILGPLETALMIALFPLARNLMLSAPVEVEAEVSEEVHKDVDVKRANEVAQTLLHGIQQSFTHTVNFKLKNTSSRGRGIRLRTRLHLAMPVNDVKALYDEVYDDHNFTFLSFRSLSTREVEGTNKCLISCCRQGIPNLTWKSSPTPACADGPAKPFWQ